MLWSKKSRRHVESERLCTGIITRARADRALSLIVTNIFPSEFEQSLPVRLEHPESTFKGVKRGAGFYRVPGS